MACHGRGGHGAGAGRAACLRRRVLEHRRRAACRLSGCERVEPVLIAADVEAAIARDAVSLRGRPARRRVLAGGQPIGWFIVDEVIGKVELIDLMSGLDATGAVKSLDVLAYRESHGIDRLAAWRANCWQAC